MNRVFDFYKPLFHQEMTLHGAVLWDADNKRVEPYHAAEMLNTLLAEVERLKTTQRKLAVIADRLIKIDQQGAGFRHVHGQALDYGDLPELLNDPFVQAAIKEASDGKA